MNYYELYIYIIKFIFNKFYINLLIINSHGIIFLRIICLCQLDVKLIIAISSIVHIRIILTSILLITKLRLYGWCYIIIRHGFISSGLFHLINLIYNQTNRRLIFINNGIINFIPSLTIIRFILCLCNVGSPFSLNLTLRHVLWKHLETKYSEISSQYITIYQKLPRLCNKY